MALWAATLGVLYVVLQGLLRAPLWSCLGVCACSTSLLLQRYCAIVLYEILAMLPVTAFVGMVAQWSPRPAAHALIGLVVALLCTFRLHFLGVLVLYALALVWQRLGAPTNEHHRPVVPTLTYLFGFLPDTWYVHSRWVDAVVGVSGLAPSAIRKGFASLYVGALAGGLLHAGAVLRRRALEPALVARLCVAGPVFTAQAVTGSSTRFLVPVIPALLILQLRALERVAAQLVARVKVAPRGR